MDRRLTLGILSPLPRLLEEEDILSLPLLPEDEFPMESVLLFSSMMVLWRLEVGFGSGI